MKIEGMQYPQSVRRIDTRGSKNSSDQKLSEDAVFFEPDDQRQDKGHNQSQEQNTEKDKLEQQVNKEETPIELAPKTQSPAKVSDKKQNVNIIV